MEFNKRSRTTNREQFALMVERMKLNGGIAKNMSNEPPEVVSVFWTSLSTDLNALGPPTKSLAEWKKVWSDFKSSIKKKLSNNRIQMRATGGGPNREVQLTVLEEEVAQLVNIPDAVAGVSGRHCGTPQGPSRGSHTDSAASEPSTSGVVNREEADNMENAENSIGNSSSPTSPQSQQRVPQRRTQLTLLKTQLDMQKKYYDNVVCNLKSQKRKMEDVANNLKKMQKTMSSLNNNVVGMRSILGNLVAETKRHNLATEQLLRHKTKVKEQLLELEIQGVKNALKK